jgi:alkaline phosphatase
VKDNPNTLLLMAADSDAGGMQLIGPGPGREMEPGKPLPATSKNGSPADGVTGTGGVPFLSAPDAKGQRWPFAITWATENDVHGGILVRAAGKNADKVKGRLDNTDIYKIMYQTLFDRPIGN